MYNFTQEQFEEWFASLDDEMIIGCWDFNHYVHVLDLFLNTLFAPNRFAVGYKVYWDLTSSTNYPCPDWMNAIMDINYNAPLEKRRAEDGSMRYLIVTKRGFLRYRERMKRDGNSSLS